MVQLSQSATDDTPKQIYNYRVYGASIVATFAAVMIGYDSAFIGTSISLKSFKDEFNLVDKTASEFNLLSANIVSLYQAGCFFGAILGCPLGYFFGRRWGLTMSAGVFCIGATLQCVASSKTGLGIIYAGRVIVGLAIGSASNLAPIYVAEIAPPAIRGRLIGIYELCWQTGGVIGFWINYGVTQNIPPGRKQWLIAFAVQLIPSGLLLFGSPFLPESPRWLVSRRPRSSKALLNLSYLRGLEPSHPYVVAELAAIRDAVEKEKDIAGEGFWGPLKKVWGSRMLLKRLAIGASLFAWQNGTGINAVNYYSPTVFKSIGLTGTSTSLLTTGVFGIIKLIGSLVWLLYLVDTLGRRSMLMIGSFGGALCMFYIGAYIAIGTPQNSVGGLSSGGVSAIVFFYLWTIFYSPSWNGTPWVLTAEMFPQHVRTFTQSCMAASNWLFGFLIARFTPQMFTKMGYGVYLFFASLMILSIFYVFFIIPETKKVPLERMEELFASGLRPWKAHGIVIRRVKENEEKHESASADKDTI
ncbi:quinate permease [Cyathus striatus]|nr:quinate permease [Cyathus striatus]